MPLPSRRGHISRSGALLSLAAATLLVVSCSGSLTGRTHPQLAQVAGHPAQSFGGVPGVSPTRHADIGSMIVCSKSSRPVRITSVAPMGETGHITVVDVRTRSSPFVEHPVREGVGVVYGSLASAGMTGHSRTILPCRSSQPLFGSEIALELSTRSGADSASRGWRFTVTDGQHTATVTYPLGVVLCSTPTMKAPTCDALWASYAEHS